MLIMFEGEQQHFDLRQHFNKLSFDVWMNFKFKYVQKMFLKTANIAEKLELKSS